MSNICLVDLKNHNLDFRKYNQLAREIIQFMLDNNLAAFFNLREYDEELIKNANIQNFFLISDSFLYHQADFLNTSSMFLDADIKQFKKDFILKYGFFNELIGIIFSYNVTSLDIYFDILNASCPDDYVVFNTNERDFTEDLFSSIIEYSDEYNFGFPTIKFEVAKCI